MRRSRLLGGGAAALSAALLVAGFLDAAPAETAFTGLGPAEAAALSRGETVVRSLGSYRELAVGGPEEKRIADDIKDLGPNYLTEVLSIIPGGRGDDPLARLGAALADVEGYVGIPYYSVQNRKTYDLFGSMSVVSRSAGEAGATIIEVLQGMKPFGEYAARYELESAGGALRFRGENTGPIGYKGMTAVRPGQMLWLIAVYPSGEGWLFYGVGAVRAFDMFGAFRGRMEASFVGRTAAFLEYMRAKIGVP